MENKTFEALYPLFGTINKQAVIERFSKEELYACCVGFAEIIQARDEEIKRKTEDVMYWVKLANSRNYKIDGTGDSRP